MNQEFLDDRRSLARKQLIRLLLEQALTGSATSSAQEIRK